jgi:hypothetical protein
MLFGQAAEETAGCHQGPGTWCCPESIDKKIPLNFIFRKSGFLTGFCAC